MTSADAGGVGDTGLAERVAELTAPPDGARGSPSAAELVARMADLNARIAALVGEVGRVQLDLVRALPADAGPVMRDDGLYYKPDGRGPFCPACYDATRRLTHLVRTSDYFKALGAWQCNACDTSHAGRK